MFICLCVCLFIYFSLFALGRSVGRLGATSIRDVIAFPLLRAETTDGAAAAASEAEAAAAATGSKGEASSP